MSGIESDPCAQQATELLAASAQAKLFPTETQADTVL
jgi:hypothetical protein